MIHYCPRCHKSPILPACFEGECSPGIIPGLYPAPTLADVGQNQRDYDAAMADRPSTLVTWQENECCAWGPGGECVRTPGHTDRDGPFTHNRHYSYDTDHYKDWPVGWKSDSALLAEARSLLAITYGIISTEQSRLRGQIETFLTRPR